MAHSHSFRTRDPGAPVVPPPAIAGLTALSALAVDRAMRRNRVLPVWTRPLGIGAVLAGISMSACAFLHFKKNDVNPSPWNRPSGFVTDGPYAISRNPMYTGVLLSLIGLGMIRGSVAALVSPVAFVALLTKGQIAFEESALEDAYGEEYRAYKRRVRRWL